MFDIPKSTLVALSRMRSEDEQLFAWEEAKHGRMTVRTAKAVQKGQGIHQARSHPLQRAVETGKGFVQRLERASKTQALPDETTVRDLYALYNQIGKIIERFSNGETQG